MDMLTGFLGLFVTLCIVQGMVILNLIRNHNINIKDANEAIFDLVNFEKNRKIYPSPWGETSYMISTTYKHDHIEIDSTEIIIGLTWWAIGYGVIQVLIAIFN